MKQNISPGAYGWRHAHWATTFYPEDLPVEAGEDWRLAYYSNEFDVVMVPCSYWQSDRAADCASWLDDVHTDFRFFIECNASMFAFISPSEFTDCLSRLRPQLSGLVFADDTSLDVESPGLETLEAEFLKAESLQPFDRIIDSLALDIFAVADVIESVPSKPVQNIWRPEHAQVSSLALIENDLSDQRSVRMLVEDFVATSVGEGQKSERGKDGASSDLSIVVSHPQLQAVDLSRLRSTLEVMGY